MRQAVGGGGRWAVVLAGGEGVRLRTLTRQLSGDDRPKQFCALLGRGTLLDETRSRLARGVSAERTLLVVARAHERFYGPVLGSTGPGALPGPLVVQPESQGTAPALLYALERIATQDPLARVVVSPSDHYVSDDDAFMAQVGQAFTAVERRPERVVLLGVTPDRPEVEYGWIEPGASPMTADWPDGLAPVRRFWEKPSRAVAEALLAWGCLWNAFVMVARVDRFRRLIRDAAPSLHEAFQPLRMAMGSRAEGSAAEAVYRDLAPVDLSRHVLTTQPEALAVLPVRGLEWNDLGEPRRVLAVRERMTARRLAGPGAGSLRPALVQ